MRDCALNTGAKGVEPIACLSDGSRWVEDMNDGDVCPRIVESTRGGPTSAWVLGPKSGSGHTAGSRFGVSQALVISDSLAHEKDEVASKLGNPGMSGDKLS